MVRYRYEGQTYDDDAKGRFGLALALVQNECGVYDEGDFEQWVNKAMTPARILWRVKEYGYDNAYFDLISEFEDWYAQENCGYILHDFIDSYDTIDDTEEEE